MHAPLLICLIATAIVLPGLTRAEETAPTRSEAILEQADIAIELAREGQYGRINRRDMQALEEAHATVKRLLDGRDAPEELANEDRVALFNAQHTITSIVGNDDKNRKICKRVAVTGSRVAATECLTVAEREARARASRNMAGEALRGYCMPGEASRCGR